MDEDELLIFAGILMRKNKDLENALLLHIKNKKAKRRLPVLSPLTEEEIVSFEAALQTIKSEEKVVTPLTATPADMFRLYYENDQHMRELITTQIRRMGSWIPYYIFNQTSFPRQDFYIPKNTYQELKQQIFKQTPAQIKIQEKMYNRMRRHGTIHPSIEAENEYKQDIEKTKQALKKKQ